MESFTVTNLPNNTPKIAIKWIGKLQEENKLLKSSMFESIENLLDNVNELKIEIDKLKEENKKLKEDLKIFGEYY